MDEWPASATCWMSHGDAIADGARGLRRHRLLARGSGRGDGGRRATTARGAVPPRGRPHRTRPGPARQLLAPRRARSRRPGPTPRSSKTRSRRSANRSATRRCSARSRAASTRRSPRRSSPRPSVTQLTCVFVDTGLMRKDEGEQIEETFTRQFGVELIHVKAQDRFFEALAGVTDPEAKRKIIGELFIREFETVARELGKGGDGPRFLVQGTLYPDVIESGSGHAANIKSHHNVGGLPRGPLLRPGRAAAQPLQGRGPPRRRGARPAGRDRLAPAVPRSGTRACASWAR